MSLLSEHFSSSYGQYKTYFGSRSERDYVYVLENNDLSTEEILKQNPSGTKEIGLTLQRSEKYHGINTSLTLEVDFSKDDYAGGTFLLTAFENKAVKADVTCTIYKLNPDTGDFDSFYVGKVDFNPDSYSHEPNERKVKATLHEEGIQNSFLSRDTIKLDVTNNTAIDGTVISDLSKSLITFKAVDIYLIGEAVNGEIVILRTFLATGNDTEYFDNGSQSIDLTGGRIDFETPTDGVVYNNSTGGSVEIRYQTQFSYVYQSEVQTGDTMTTYIRFYVYNSADSIIDTNVLLTITNSGEGIKNQTGNETFDSDYITVPDGGYCRYYAYTTFTGTNQADVSFTQVGTRTHEFEERSPSIGDTQRSPPAR